MSDEEMPPRFKLRQISELANDAQSTAEALRQYADHVRQRAPDYARSLYATADELEQEAYDHIALNLGNDVTAILERLKTEDE